MSGIYGIIGEASSAELHAMGARLAHRGAHGKEWSISSTVHFGERVEATDTRNLVPSDYPIAFDGFVDNRNQLAELVGRNLADAEYQTEADLVYEIVRKFGLDGLAHLNGQFALAIWDSDGQRLILARDALATRPFYYAKVGDRYIFASEYKALLAIDDLPVVPNRDAIQFVNSTKHALPNASCLEGIYPVPGGSWLAIGRSGTSTGRYYDLRVNIERRSEKHHAADLHSAILDAVRLQIERYDTVGLALSGGLDSVVTLAAIRAVGGDKSVHTFTAGHGADDDEIVGAKVASEAFNSEHHEIILNPLELPEILPRMVWHMEDPLGREEKVFHFMTAREAAKHVSILLAGHGADALFGGMPRHRIVRLASMMPFISRPLEEFYRYSQTGIQADTLIGRGMISLYYKGTQVPPPNVLGAAPLSSERIFPLETAQPLGEMLRRGIVEDANANSSTERIYSASGINFNSPFMEANLIRQAFTIPDGLKIHRLNQKYILRRAFDGMLPEALLKRKKSLTRLKRDNQLAVVLDGLADEYLSPSAVRSRGIFEPEYVEAMRQKPKSSTYGSEQMYRLWSLLLTEIWCRLFLDARGAQPVDVGSGAMNLPCQGD